MNLESLRAAISEQATAALIPRLIDRAKALHARREWRQCGCAWCRTKRDATVAIASVQGPRVHRNDLREIRRFAWRRRMAIEMDRALLEGEGR